MHPGGRDISRDDFCLAFFFRRNISWHNKNTYIRPYLAYTGPHEQLCVMRYLVHECERLTFLSFFCYLFVSLFLSFFLFFGKDRCTGFKLQKLLLRGLYGCKNVQFLKRIFDFYKDENFLLLYSLKYKEKKL